MIELLVLLGLATWRVTRFALYDALIDTPRNRVHAWLLTRRHATAVTVKIHELITCPWCLSVWVAAVAVAVADGWASIPLPAFMWLAVAAVAVIVHVLVEAD